MPTRNSKQTVLERIERDPAFVQELVKEAIHQHAEGNEPDIARSLLQELLETQAGLSTVVQLLAKGLPT